MDSEYSDEDISASGASDSDSEGSLCDFIVNDNCDDVDKTEEENENELQTIVNDLREDERALLTQGRPRRTRKQTVRYIDPDYCKLMELDTLSQSEVDYIMNGSRTKTRSEKSKKKAKPSRASITSRPPVNANGASSLSSSASARGRKRKGERQTQKRKISKISTKKVKAIRAKH